MTDNELMDLYRKVSLFGLSDLRRLAPIGDIGYLNGISFYRGKSFGSFLRSTLIDWVYKAYCEQFKKMGWTERHIELKMRYNECREVRHGKQY